MGCASGRSRPKLITLSLAAARRVQLSVDHRVGTERRDAALHPERSRDAHRRAAADRRRCGVRFLRLRCDAHLADRRALHRACSAASTRSCSMRSARRSTRSSPARISTIRTMPLCACWSTACAARDSAGDRPTRLLRRARIGATTCIAPATGSGWTFTMSGCTGSVASREPRAGDGADGRARIVYRADDDEVAREFSRRRDPDRGRRAGYRGRSRSDDGGDAEVGCGCRSTDYCAIVNSIVTSTNDNCCGRPRTQLCNCLFHCGNRILRYHVARRPGSCDCIGTGTWFARNRIDWRIPRRRATAPQRSAYSSRARAIVVIIPGAGAADDRFGAVSLVAPDFDFCA